MNETDKKEVLAMIDYSNVEIHKMMQSMDLSYLDSQVNHWIDQFYKLLKANANKLEVKRK